MADVDLNKRQLTVERSDWKGHVTSTKGGRVRYVPMTVRLAQALHRHRHLCGRRVLCQDDSAPMTQKIVQDHVRRAAQLAKLQLGVHILRHHLLLALGDAWGAGEGDPSTRRA